MSYIVKKYTISDDDLHVVQRWVKNQQLKSVDFPHGNSKLAMEAFYQLEPFTSMALNKWCESHLDSEQWHRLKGTIRQERHLNKNGLTNRIAVSIEADSVLDRISKTNGMTKSEIIDYLVGSHSGELLV